MRKRKKYLIVGAVALSLVIVAGLGITAAWGPHGRWHRGAHHGLHGDDVADFIFWKMDRHVKGLNLDDTQRQEYERIKGEVKATITEAMKTRREFHRMMHEEIHKQNPDLNKVANLVKERLQGMPEILGKNLDLFMDFYNQVLNDEQKAQVIKTIRDRWA